MSILAIVLAGGRSSRMGGAHKPALEVGGRSVVDRVIAAVRAAEPHAEVIVAGAADGVTDPRVRVVREDPPFAGPVAGVAAALAAVDAADRTVVILAGDMPSLSPGALRALIDAPGVAVAHTDRPQPLCAAWPEPVLRAALARLGDPANAAMRALMRGVDVMHVPVDPAAVDDIDTPDDLTRARSMRGD